MHHVPGLYIANTEDRGRGVFTSHEINPSDSIEICPVIFIPKDQLETIHNTVFHDYYILWPGKENTACIALGYGSLYNHSNSPNAEIILDLDHETVDFKCIKPIAEGDEILIDYTDGLKDAPKLWFEVK